MRFGLSALVTMGVGLLGACGGPVLYLPADGCVLDAECKGQRICFEARCVFPAEVGRDAGPSDAGVDAGPPDAGSPDAGSSDAGPDAGAPDAGGGNGIIGDACEGSGDCAEGDLPLCYSEADTFGTFPGGYCSTECSPDQPCPEGTLCGMIFGTTGACLRACQSSDVCRPDYLCSDLLGPLACVPAALVP